MRINTNVSALDTIRNLGNTQNALASSTAKLSSGFRINKASDDAAGLAIANKLRNTGRALGAAAKNVEQGTAMLQIADGSLQSIASILDRMKELSTQYGSANTGTDAQANIQAEFDVLSTEIDRSSRRQRTKVRTCSDRAWRSRSTRPARAMTPSRLISAPSRSRPAVSM
jgi:Flagellin and related hook-associated proteins